MKIRLIFLFISLPLFTITLNAKERAPAAVNGMLDLRRIKNPDHFMIKLNGDWEFYWKKMLRPFDFKTGNFKPDYYGKVPSYWTDYPPDSVKTENFGWI
jgi:hypothetical protein